MRKGYLRYMLKYIRKGRLVETRTAYWVTELQSRGHVHAHWAFTTGSGWQAGEWLGLGVGIYLGGWELALTTVRAVSPALHASSSTQADRCRVSVRVIVRLQVIEKLMCHRRLKRRVAHSGATLV